MSGQLLDPEATEVVLQQIGDERVAQDAKWGQQDHPDGTGTPSDKRYADAARALCNLYAKKGKVTWKMILDEEVREAFAESDPDKLREDLLQVAAVAAAWAEAIDRREAAARSEVKGGICTMLTTCIRCGATEDLSGAEDLTAAEVLVWMQEHGPRKCQKKVAA